LTTAINCATSIRRELLMSKQIAQNVNQSMDRLPEELKSAIMLREIEA